MIGQVTSALAGHLASGGLLVTAFLSMTNVVPPGFVRFCTAAASGLAVLAAVLAPPGSPERWLLGGLGAAALGYHVVVRRQGRTPGLGVTTVAAALVSIGSCALIAWLAAGEPSWLSVAGALSSALLLGAVTVTMILGHWYLVDTSLSIAPLKDGARVVSLAVVARLAIVAGALLLGGWETLRVNRAADLVFSTNGLFFLFRSLMGLAAPLVIAALIWQTVKIRSTQSATGLLYVALMLVLFGELVSGFLRLTTGFPL
jgi:hypothetical protein